MLEQIFQFFLGAGQEAALFIISMIPLIELRGSIPLGAALGMPWYMVFLISVIGNLLPIPFLILFVRPVFAWLKRRSLFSCLVARLENKLISKAGKVTQYEVIGLTLFVAIPLPGTGAWSGAGIAALLGMRLRHALPSIVAGVFIAGCIMTAASYGIASIFSAFA